MAKNIMQIKSNPAEFLEEMMYQCYECVHLSDQSCPLRKLVSIEPRPMIISSFFEHHDGNKEENDFWVCLMHVEQED